MKRTWIVAAIGATLLSAGAWAQWGPGMGGYGMGYGMGGYGGGPGMMGGYGASGECPGYGPGPRGGAGEGYGPGMMGGGRGLGMGQGPGQGQGMRGGYGWAYRSLDLTDEQRDKIAAIGKEMHEKQWGLMQTMHGLMWKSEPGSLSEADVLKNFDAMTAVRREMLAARLDTRKRMDEVLTKEQREQLRKQERRYEW